jgi:hypothetical protein
MILHQPLKLNDTSGTKQEKKRADKRADKEQSV